MVTLEPKAPSEKVPIMDLTGLTSQFASSSHGQWWNAQPCQEPTDRVI